MQKNQPDSYKLNVLRSVEIGLLSGLTAGLIKGFLFVDSNEYVRHGLYRIALFNFQKYINSYTTIAVAVLFLSGVTYSVLKYYARKTEIAGAAVSALVISSGVFFIAANIINKAEWFPDALSSRGIMYNIAIFIFCIVVFGAISFKVSIPVILKLQKRELKFLRKLFNRKVAAVALVSLASLNAVAFVYGYYGQQSLLKDKPNIILISADTLRADHVSCYGYNRETTPNIDAFSREGILFKDTVSTSAWTVPAHLSMMTSLYPSRHGVVEYPMPGRLSDSFSTLAEVLKNEGYVTAGFTGGGNVSAAFGFRQGFDKYISYGRRFEDNLDHVFNWLNDNREKRFFLFLHAYNAHKPYMSPAPYNTKYFPDYDGYVDVDTWCTEGKQSSDDPIDVKYMIAQYDGAVNHMDSIMGSFFRKLKETGIYDNTIIVFVSDHGDEFLEHGRCDHIRSLYEEVIKVPLIIKAPGLAGNKKIDRQVSIVDIMPTIFSLINISPDISVTGNSLVPLINGKTYPAAYAYGETRYYENDELMNIRSIRTGDRKLISQKIIGEDNESVYSLFNLIEDPRETSDLTEREPRTAQKLMDRLFTYTSISQGAGYSRPQEVRMDAETMKQLKSLGYVAK